LRFRVEVLLERLRPTVTEERKSGVARRGSSVSRYLLSGFRAGIQGLGTKWQRFRGGLVFKVQRLLYHSTLGLRVIKKSVESAIRIR
jgi:hypothetical protein